MLSCLLFSLKRFKNGSVKIFMAFSRSETLYVKFIMLLPELLVFTIIHCIGANKKEHLALNQRKLSLSNIVPKRQPKWVIICPSPLGANILRPISSRLEQAFFVSILCPRKLAGHYCRSMQLFMIERFSNDISLKEFNFQSYTWQLSGISWWTYSVDILYSAHSLICTMSYWPFPSNI